MANTLEWVLERERDVPVFFVYALHAVVAGGAQYFPPRLHDKYIRYDTQGYNFHPFPHINIPL